MMRCLFVLVCGLIAFRATAQINKDSVQIAADSIHIGDTTVIAKDTITVIGVGDIMMGTNYPENKLPEDDGSFLMKGVETHFRNADITLLRFQNSGFLCKESGKCRL
jgi:hypothetical protein